ncbi:MAG: methylated-DNA--[protein]-cysteine S-methyltransferase [Candidatus Cardinium sp.]|uniref:methylated-DNA--[protein]-cysteine S-methyltransferase n=1 Tax=Cardinium endosymbiont of Dermatophagoides farinae TaxID=2597823 RepID=UPI0011833C7A|nr:methylated-DNA--[protein]-cysteine S-methyltransferase [Cardinium endosymbiont of Dermatophagoides farinae]TSJ80980.1 methylated-DNA--[protein]-cysteine S-methyltransferase [Cardinium endosymbiont of Dermatophagoides farinae]UWW97007.1 MAG: methylated-DNA--[protein]-cysteine S-methyltransferase [Candidatus Cardinium sp.]
METTKEMLYYSYTKTPIGTILLTAHYNQLTGLYLEGQKYFPVIPNQWQYHTDKMVFKETKLQLDDYFILKRTAFTIDYKLIGTDFQINIWKSLLKIPYGEVCTYKAFAALTAYPNAIRAVASAIGRNPLSILLPCHRVISSDGSLGGYAGGIAVKKELLALEDSITSA